MVLDDPRDRLVLCMDAGASLRHLDKYWGEGTAHQVAWRVYGNRSFLFRYPKRFELPWYTLFKSNNTLAAAWAPGDHSSTLHVMDLVGGWVSVGEAVRILGIPPPLEWRECHDVADMTSACWSPDGIPTQSPVDPRVHMVGMLSPRLTTYASVEAAAEVGIRWCGRPPREPMKATTIAFLLVTFYLLVMIYHAKARFKVITI